MENRASLHQSHSDHRLLLVDRAMVRQDQHHIGDKNNYYFLKKLQKDLVV